MTTIITGDSILHTLLLKYIDEAELNNLIANSSNHNLLKELLKLKYHLIVQGKHQRLHYPIYSLLTTVNFLKSKDDAEILKHVLLIQSDNKELKVFEDFVVEKLNAMEATVEYLIMVFHLLDIALSLIENDNTEINIDKADLFKFYKVLCNMDSNEFMLLVSTITKRLITKISTTSILDCFEAVLTSDNIAVLCCTIEFFFCNNSKLATCSLLCKHNIWQKIPSLISSYTTTNQRQGIFLLQQIKDYYISNELFEAPGSGYIKLPEFNAQDTESAWHAFFMLSHVSREKQIHLVKPALTFLPDLFRLHSLWIKTAYFILLSHAQNEVVSLAAIHILNSKWFGNIANFLLLHKHLLEAISKTDYSIVTIETFVVLGNYLSLCPDETFWILLKESNKLAWNPLNMWLYCKNAFKRSSLKYVKCEVITSFLKHLQALPHKFIRNGCMCLCLRFFGRVQTNEVISSEDLVKLSTIVNATDVSFEFFCKVFMNTILIHKVDLENQIVEIQLMKLDEAVTVLHLWKTIDHKGTVFRGCSLKEFPLDLLVKVFTMYDLWNNTRNVAFAFNGLERAMNSCTREVLKDSKCLVDKLSTDVACCKLYKNKILDLCSIAKAVIKRSTVITEYCVYELAIKVLRCFSQESLNVEDIFDACESQILITKEDTLLIELLEILLHNVSQDSITRLKNILEMVYEKGSEIVVSAVLKNLAPFLSELLENKDMLHVVLENSIKQILRLKRGELFKTTLEIYLKTISDIKSLHQVAPEKCYEIAQLVLELSGKYNFIVHILTSHLRRLIDCCPSKAGTYIDVFVECLLNDACIRKEERNEYVVCKDISKTVCEINDGSYVYQHAFSKYLIFEGILYLINNQDVPCEEREKFADNFAHALVLQYKIHLNKRYFKDSMIHIRKLRILQTFLLLQPYLCASKKEVVDVMLASIYTESHQHCVRQLIEWLLIRLLNGDEDTLNIIVNGLESAVSTKVSTVSALISILYHVTLLNNTEDIWLRTMDLLLPWTMGANFKLRVYTQVSIHKLYEKAVQYNFTEIITKYSHTYTCINTIISKADDCIKSCLQTDEIIFKYFDPLEHYSLEAILIDIPRMNTLIRSEWEGYTSIPLMKFQSIQGVSLFKTFIPEEGVVQETDKETVGDIDIIQRKISPWKEILQNKEQVKEITKLVVVATFVDKTANIGGLTRTCEIFGIKQLIIHDMKITNDKEYKSLSMCSEGWLNITEVKKKDIKDFLFGMKSQGYTVVAAEQTSSSVNLHHHKFEENTVLLLGNEKEGIPANVLPLADICVEIPQMGVTRSLNVHVAGSLFIWEYSKQHVFK